MGGSLCGRGGGGVRLAIDSLCSPACFPLKLFPLSACKQVKRLQGVLHSVATIPLYVQSASVTPSHSSYHHHITTHLPCQQHENSMKTATLKSSVLS